ncbi:MAG: cobalt-precorrin-5B (C(1))-methyltransferase, partial [Candidatus Caldatribacteriaceae bacterium]
QDCSQVVLTFGNYGHQYARGRGFSDEVIVSCGNFLGFALEKVLALGFEKVIIIGELGKLAKVAGGIFLTDSRIADARMEILASFAALFGVKQTTIARIFQASLTEEVLGYLEEEGVSLLEFGNFVAARTKKRVMEHTQGRVTVVVEVFSLKRGFLGRAE